MRDCFESVRGAILETEQDVDLPGLCEGIRSAKTNVTQLCCEFTVSEVAIFTRNESVGNECQLETCLISELNLTKRRAESFRVAEED